MTGHVLSLLPCPPLKFPSSEFNMSLNRDRVQNFQVLNSEFKRGGFNGELTCHVCFFVKCSNGEFTEKLMCSPFLNGD